MKIFKLVLLSITFISSSLYAQQFASSGMQVSFNITSINPAATFANVNKYMNSGDFKKLGISAGLYAFNANGDDPTTHVIDFYYTDIDSYQKAIEVAATSAAVAELQTTGLKNGTINTSETVYMNVREKITPQDVEKNKAFYIWRVQTSDLPRYMAAWDKMISEIEELGIASDSYGMKVAFAGAVKGETLFVWAGYENHKQMMEQLAVFNASDTLAEFNRATQSYSEVVSNEISSQLSLWNGELYTQ